MTYEDNEIYREGEEDVYSDARIEDMAEDDEITSYEAGFMAGYNSADY